MDNPMADAGELGLTDMNGTAVVNRRDRALIIIAGDRPLDEVAPLRVRYREPRCCPYSLDLPMSRGRERSVGPVSNTENLMLDEPALITRIGSCMRLTSWAGRASAFIRPRSGTGRCRPACRPGNRVLWQQT